MRPPFTNKWMPCSNSFAVRVYIGSEFAWDRARREVRLGFPASILPVDDVPTNYDWPVTKRDVFVHALKAVTPKINYEICDAIMCAGANSVMTLGNCEALYLHRSKEILN